MSYTLDETRDARRRLKNALDVVEWGHTSQKVTEVNQVFTYAKMIADANEVRLAAIGEAVEKLQHDPG